MVITERYTANNEQTARAFEAWNEQGAPMHVSADAPARFSARITIRAGYVVVEEWVTKSWSIQGCFMVQRWLEPTLCVALTKKNKLNERYIYNPIANGTAGDYIREAHKAWGNSGYDTPFVYVIG